MKTLIPFSLLLLSFVTTLQAFPPAPYYTLYGIVRDQDGHRH